MSFGLSSLVPWFSCLFLQAYYYDSYPQEGYLMANNYRNVSNTAELTIALYEDAQDIKITGSLASGVYYGCKSFNGLGVCLILLFSSLFTSIYFPSVMLPAAIVFGALIALFCLPLIFLSFAHISLRMVNRIRRCYQPVLFDSGAQTLILQSSVEYSGTPREMPTRRPLFKKGKGKNNPYSRI